MTLIDQIELLLEKVDSITWKYRHVLHGPEYRFNIFAILRREDDEVYLHSRFLAELLDPDGDHCQGDALLDAFLRQIGIEGFRMGSVSVRREYQDIDILVTNEDQAIIIENKVYAQDQKRQLERYYRAMRREGFEAIRVVYLTLDGAQPSRYSLGDLPRIVGDDAVHCISYEEDVHAWLDTCIGLSSRHPVLRETLVQYQRLVERLTGQSFSRDYIMEITELLKDEKNIELAVNISRALVEAQIDIQLAFWEELERQLGRAGFQIARGQPYYNTYSRQRVRKYYETKRAGRHFGIVVNLADYDEATELVYYVKAGWRIYYGFAAFRDGTRKIAQEAQFDDLAALVKEVDPSFERTDYSIGLKRASELRFKSFDNPTVFALANPEKRDQIVEDFVDEIVTHIKGFKRRYEPSAAAAAGGLETDG